MQKATHATLDIEASDVEPGVIVLTFTQGTFSFPVRLAGEAAFKFAHAFALAYARAFDDQLGAAGINAKGQFEALIKQMEQP